MAHLQLPVPDWLNENYMEGIVRQHWKDSEAVVRQMTVTPGSKVGENYSCQIFRIKLTVDIGDKPKELSMIGKLKVETDAGKVFDEQFDVFCVEALFFEVLNPGFQEAIKSVETAKTFSPECYAVDREKKIILMEDLVANNFVLQPRGQFLSMDLALLAVEALATMHGASLHVVAKDPTLKTRFNESLWIKPNEVFIKWFENFRVFMDGDAESLGVSSERCAKLRALGDNLSDNPLKNVCDLHEDSLNVILHGDLWMNNMMYHFTEGVPDDVILLDYEVTNYNCFALDLHYFLFTSVQSDVIVNNLDTFLEAYVNKLKEVAPPDAMLEINVERIEREFFERAYFGLFIGLVFRGFFVQETPVDLDKILEGVIDDRGFRHPQYVADVHNFLPFFEKAGVF